MDSLGEFKKFLSDSQESIAAAVSEMTEVQEAFSSRYEEIQARHTGECEQIAGLLKANPGEVPGGLEDLVREGVSEERAVLEEELTAAGVDLDDLEGEAARLRAEAGEALSRAESLVTEFNQKLEAAAVSGGAPAEAEGEIDIG